MRKVNYRICISILFIALHTAAGAVNQVTLKQKKNAAVATFNLLNKYLKVSDLHKDAMPGYSVEEEFDFLELFEPNALVWDDITPSNFPDDFLTTSEKPVTVLVEDYKKHFPEKIYIKYLKSNVDFSNLHNNSAKIAIERVISGNYAGSYFISNTGSVYEILLIFSNDYKSAKICEIKRVYNSSIPCPECPEKPKVKKTEKEEKAEKTEKPDKAEKADKAERPEKAEKTEKPSKAEKVEKADKAEKPEKAEKTEKAEKPGKAEKVEKADKAEKPENAEKTEKADKAEKAEEKKEIILPTGPPIQTEAPVLKNEDYDQMINNAIGENIRFIQEISYTTFKQMEHPLMGWKILMKKVSDDKDTKIPVREIINLSDKSAPPPVVISKTPGRLVCNYDGAEYQWGYDDLRTLDSEKLKGANKQEYILPADADTTGRAYWVIVKDDDCFTKSYEDRKLLLNIAAANDSTGFSLFPIPAVNTVNLFTTKPIFGYIIYDLDGKALVVMRALKNDHYFNIDITSLKNGEYIFEVETFNHSIKTKRLLILR